MAPNGLERSRSCYLPVTPLIRENYLPDKPNCLPVRLLFGAPLRYLANYLKRTDFRRLSPSESPRSCVKRGANREDQREEAEIGAKAMRRMLGKGNGASPILRPQAAEQTLTYRPWRVDSSAAATGRRKSVVLRGPCGASGLEGRSRRRHDQENLHAYARSLRCYSPRYTGFRFSLNAFRPST
jgi:hypothetical protein